MLIYFQAQIDSQAENGSTPLYIACQKGRLEAVQYLTSAGADVNLSKHDTQAHASC